MWRLHVSLDFFGRKRPETGVDQEHAKGGGMGSEFSDARECSSNHFYHKESLSFAMGEAAYPHQQEASGPLKLLFPERLTVGGKNFRRQLYEEEHQPAPPLNNRPAAGFECRDAVIRTSHQVTDSID